MSSKDKKARRAAMRDFLVETPGALDRVSASLGWLVVLGAIALAALMLHLAWAPHGPLPVPPPGGQGDNPRATLFVRDLGRLPDGRHTFDLVYAVLLRNATDRPFSVDSTFERLSIGDPAPIGDVIDLGRIAWHQVFAKRDMMSGRPGGADLLPGQWRVYRAHYRIRAMPEQFADVAIGYGLHRAAHGWFGHAGQADDDMHDEQVQLGAVLRGHCPLGVKVTNGEMRSLCGL